MAKKFSTQELGYLFLVAQRELYEQDKRTLTKYLTDKGIIAPNQTPNEAHWKTNMAFCVDHYHLERVLNKNKFEAFDQYLKDVDQYGYGSKETEKSFATLTSDKPIFLPQPDNKVPTIESEKTYKLFATQADLFIKNPNAFHHTLDDVLAKTVEIANIYVDYQKKTNQGPAKLPITLKDINKNAIRKAANALKDNNAGVMLGTQGVYSEVDETGKQFIRGVRMAIEDYQKNPAKLYANIVTNADVPYLDQFNKSEVNAENKNEIKVEPKEEIKEEIKEKSEQDVADNDNIIKVNNNNIINVNNNIINVNNNANDNIIVDDSQKELGQVNNNNIINVNDNIINVNNNANDNIIEKNDDNVIHLFDSNNNINNVNNKPLQQSDSVIINQEDKKLDQSNSALNISDDNVMKEKPVEENDEIIINTNQKKESPVISELGQSSNVVLPDKPVLTNIQAATFLRIAQEQRFNVIVDDMVTFRFELETCKLDYPENKMIVKANANFDKYRAEVGSNGFTDKAYNLFIDAKPRPTTPPDEFVKTLNKMDESFTKDKFKVGENEMYDIAIGLARDCGFDVTELNKKQVVSLYKSTYGKAKFSSVIGDFDDKPKADKALYYALYGKYVGNDKKLFNDYFKSINDDKAVFDNAHKKLNLNQKYMNTAIRFGTQFNKLNPIIQNETLNKEYSRTTLVSVMSQFAALSKVHNQFGRRPWFYGIRSLFGAKSVEGYTKEKEVYNEYKRLLTAMGVSKDTIKYLSDNSRNGKLPESKVINQELKNCKEFREQIAELTNKLKQIDAEREQQKQLKVQIDKANKIDKNPTLQGRTMYQAALIEKMFELPDYIPETETTEDTEEVSTSNEQPREKLSGKGLENLKNMENGNIGKQTQEFVDPNKNKELSKEKDEIKQQAK